MNEATLNQAEGLEFCDQINLQDFNQIQSYGALLVVNMDLKVIQCSENLPELFGVAIENLLDHSVLHVLKPAFAGEDIKSLLTDNLGRHQRGLINDTPVFFRTIIQPKSILIEIEKSVQVLSEYTSLFDSTQHVAASIRQTMACTSIVSLGNTMCEEIKKLTQYQRILIYRFNQDDLTGVVVGEAIDEGMESYMGLHFPANDVPRSVREMYLKLPVRYIPNRLHEPVKMTPSLNPETGLPTDLTLSNLRMVAPVHTTYMKNMNVTSSISVGIVRDNKLWGLIACHHREPHTLPFKMRMMLPMIADIISSKAETIESTAELRDQESAHVLQAGLSKSLEGTKSLADGLEEHSKELMEIVSATGMSFFSNNVLLSYGVTPNEHEILELMSWLDKKNDFSTFSTSNLPSEYPESAAYKKICSGILAIKITPRGSHYLLFYKPEYIDTVVWAGNPCNAVEFSGDSYSPRDSFERFLVSTQNQSSPWRKHDLTSTTLIHSLIAAKQLQEILQEEVLHDPLTTLLNRRLLEQTLSLEILRSNRERKPLAVLILDIDHFKSTNDTLGHLAGDALLKGFAELIQKQFRPYDSIYRYGGDEFLVVFPNVTLETAIEKANALRINVKKIQIDFEGKPLPPFTVSLGVAAYPVKGHDAKTLIQAADDALYRAKEQGRDRVMS